MSTEKDRQRKADSRSWKKRLQSEIGAAARVLILGIGNPDQGDDGAGVACARALKKSLGGKARGRLKILIGYDTPESTTGEIRRFGPNLVLMIDAAAGPYRPGTIFVVENGAIADEGISTHKISLSMLVRYLEESIGCRVLVLGIQPGNLANRVVHEGLSEPVKKAVDEILDYCSKYVPWGEGSLPG